MANEQLTQELLALPLSERVDLAQALWQSINEAPGLATADEEREAVALAKQRDAELASGAVNGRSHEQVMETARRTLACD